MGASTVILPGAEVYPALERGVVDAIEWSSASVNLPSGFHKIAKYIIMPGVHTPGGVIECSFNLDAWDRLPERDREMIRLAGRLMMMDSWTRYAYWDISALEKMREAGNEFVSLDREFLRVAFEEAEKWEDEQAAKDPWFKRVLDHRREFQTAMKSWPTFRFPIGQR